MVTVIAAADEELHAPAAAAHWQESYYFNWVDVGGDALGFARLGYRFAERQADAVVITMRGGRRELVYGAVDQPIVGDPLALRCADGLTVGRLTFRCDEPLRQWRITLSGRNEIDLTWTALAPAFDFGHNGTEVIAQRHFEHPGAVAGRSVIRGRHQQISGFGTRDKSWGPETGATSPAGIGSRRNSAPTWPSPSPRPLPTPSPFSPASSAVTADHAGSPASIWVTSPVERTAPAMPS